ncbi:phage tail tape measure protein [Hathewaya histolytica]|uniref:Phage protein n=1 Tax=Hathewaya histolytica TaxID=1498 RepID=A0A4U9R711_HATHI|nr:phage tail tape measure protein [Hathewaya histolytica]VTQ87019.1 phage protein [Hathewaya histolytica]
MADGKIIIDTKIDESGAAKGLKKLGSLAKGSVSIFTKSLAGVGAAMTGIATYAYKVGSSFEEGMSKVQAISGATQKDIDLLGKKAKEMGAKTKFSATESAAAMEYMAMAGWKTKDMLGGIEGIMNLAAASGEDLVSTSDIVTDALTAFGMQAKDSAKFADLLASAASNSNTNVGMLGESFKYVAPVAGSLKMSAKDTAFALGLMANSGIKASQSGTALRGALTNLVKPSDKMKAAMKDLGISITDSNGKVKQGKVLYDELRQKFAKLSDAQKTQYAATIFGKEAMSGMLAIINASDSDYKKLYENLSSCEGAAQKMADTMNDNVKGQLTLLKSAAEGLGIELYESVNNPMKDIIKSANSFVGQLSTAFSKGGFTGMVGAVGNIFAQIITSIAEKTPEFVKLGTEVLKSFLDGIKNNRNSIAMGAFNLMQSFVEGIMQFIPQLLETAFLLMEEFGKGLTDNIPNLITKITEGINQILNLLMEHLPQLIDLAADIIVKLAEGFSQGFPAMLTKILELIVKICDKLIENMPKIIKAGMELLKGLVQGLMDNLPYLIENIPRIINSFMDELMANLPQILKGGVQIILALIKGLIKAIPTLIANIPAIIKAIFNAITLFNWASAGKNVISNIGKGLSSMKGNIGGIAKGIGNGIMEAFKGIFSGGADIGKNLVKGLWNGINAMTNWVLGLVKGFAKGIIKSIKGIFGIHSPSRVMRDLIGRNIVKGIGVGVDVETPNLEDDINTNMNDLIGKMQTTVGLETSKATMCISNRANKENSISTITNNNDNGLKINIEKFENNTDKDPQTLMEELEFYRKQNRLARGGV